MRNRASPILLSVLAAGCVYHSSYFLSDPKLGSSFDRPGAVVSGQSDRWTLLWFKPLGDDSAGAVLDGIKKNQNVNADSIVGARAEKTLVCFPFCFWPALSWSKTVVTGTRLDNSLVRPYEPRRPAPPPALLPPGELPEPSVLIDRLENLFESDPQEAGLFYQSLGGGDQDEIRSRIVGQGGTVQARTGFFVAFPKTDPARLRFLKWFVGRFTPYVFAEP